MACRAISAAQYRVISTDETQRSSGNEEIAFVTQFIASSASCRQTCGDENAV
jgi:hypothetical protein